MPFDENSEANEVFKCSKKAKTLELLLSDYINLKASRDFWFYACWVSLGALLMCSALLNK